MRASMSSFAILALSLGLTASFSIAGCSKKEEASSDDDKKKKKKDDDDDGKKKKKKDDDDDGKKKKDDDDDGKKKKKKDDDDGEKPKSKGGALSGTFEGNKVEFKYGRTSTWGGLHLELSTEKVTCKGTLPDEAYTIAFDVPAGPGGKFYAGKDFGVQMYLNNQRIKLKQTYVPAAFAKIHLDDFKLKDGEKIKGSLEFDTKYIEMKGDDKKEWKYQAGGDFEVTICEDYDNFKKVKAGALEDKAPSGDVAGEHGGEKFEYKTALVIVQKDFNMKKEYVYTVEFYADADVSCSSRWDDQKKHAYFFVDYLGGASVTYNFKGSPQPATAHMSYPKKGGGLSNWKSFGYSGGARAWIQFDKLTFENGDKVSGTVFAESSSDAKADEKGKIGGKFEGKVCNSGF